MITKYSHIILCVLLVTVSQLLFAQDISLSRSKNTTEEATDTLPPPPNNYQLSLNQIDCKVERKSDSSKYISKTRIVEMYGNAQITYCGMVLEADQIFYNTETGEAQAFGQRDSLNNITGYATFNDGSQEMQYKQLRYNFKTQKGKVKQLVTQQGEGIVRGKVVKQTEPGEFFVKETIYTTCNLEHPHYYFTFDKSKIKNDKFAAGKNLNLYIKDIPTPLYFPFAIFPLERGKRAGFTRPAPGFEQQRGFRLSNVGWYQPIDDHQDAIVTADFYTSGSWNTRLNYRYKKNYKYNANVNFVYSKLKGLNATVADALGENYSNSFQLDLTLNQDPKVWPNANLNARLNFGQQNFKQLNVTDPDEQLNNRYASSISFNQKFPNSPFRTDLAMRYDQNTQNNEVSLRLPEGNLSMATIYPFRGKSKTGKSSPLENVNLSYTTQFKNQIKTVDSLFFDNPINEIANGQYGVQHSIPVSTNLKVAKFFTFTPSIRYNEVWSSQNREYRWDEANQELVIDTVNVFRTARWYSTGVGFNTQIFGFKEFSKPNSKIKAIRHVMTPSIGFSYTPDFTKATSKGQPIFYDVQDDAMGNMRRVSRFDGAIYQPSLTEGGGSISFGLGNNLEMKVRSNNEKDTTGYKKIKIFESLSINTSYNLGLDSLNLSNISVRGNTKLFKKVTMQIQGQFDPYSRDPQTGRPIDTFYFKKNNGLADFVSGQFQLSGSLNSKKDESVAQEVQLISNPLYPNQQLFVDNYMNHYVDFSIPWDINMNYVLGYNKTYTSDGTNLKENYNIRNSIRGSVNMNVTDNWKVDLRTGYDFRNGTMNNTQVNVFRDLHCWQMSFNWVPIGNKQYTFTIAPKSSMLRDLKLEKRRTRFDNFN